MKKYKKLKARCDKLWSELVFNRDKGVCQKCGEMGLHPHHFILRANIGTRFELDNGVLLCAECHRWAHDYPFLFDVWFYNYIGRHLYCQLKRFSRHLKIDIDDVYGGLKEMRENQG